MLISFLKGILLLFFASFISIVIFFLLSLEGEIILNFSNKEVEISFLTAGLTFFIFFVISVIVIYFFGFLNFILNFLNGKETFINKFLDKSRKRRGYKALTNAFFSIDSGDNTQALIQSRNALKFLKNDRLALLINAKILERSGFHSKASEVYKSLMDIKSSKLVAMNGLVENKIVQGENDLALKFAYKNFELNPKNLQVIEKLYDLQIKGKDWKGAISSLYKRQKFSKLPREILKRKEAILLYAESIKLKEDNQIAKSINLVKESLRLSPDLVPAICHHALLEKILNNRERSEKILVKGWQLYAHPEISETFSNLVSEETNIEKFERFKKILKKDDYRCEALVQKIKLLILIEDFPQAKRELKKIKDIMSDIRVYLMMVSVEKGLGADENKIKDLLSKAILCKTSSEWVCDNCNNFGNWEVVCSNCNSLDSFSWRKPPSLTTNNLKKFFIPLISNSFELNNVLTDKLKEEENEMETSKNKIVKKNKINENNKDLIDKKDLIIKSAREII